MYRVVLALLIIVVSITAAVAQDGQPITPNQSLLVDIQDGSVDLIYAAPGPGLISVSARSVDGSLDTLLEVYAPDGTLLERNDDAINPPSNFGSRDSVISNLPLAAAGNYVIRVTSFSGADTGEVEVLLEGSPAVRGAGGEVKTLLVTEPLRIVLTGNGAVDLAYTIADTQSINLYARNLDINTSAIDTTLEIIDPSGLSLASNDDLANGNRDAGFEGIILPQPGTYTIRLGSFDPTQAGGVEVVLEVVSQGPEQPQGAGVLLDEVVRLDGLTPAAFTFEASVGDVITISAEALDPTAPDLDLLLKLFNPGAIQIAEDDDSGAGIGLGVTDPLIQSFEITAAGQYRVEISSYFRGAGEVAVRIERE
ncbi:MAG: pre-peptidase C-terminal domain-containing protein [Anaerolineae bacterium]|nr:pre-peptidase C-terminal domain-containing protein [Anaerolineae bacterium]